MATMGLKMFAWAKMATEPTDAIPTYEPGFVLGKAVSTNLTVTNAEGELYADDMLAEYVSEFVSAELTAETDNIDLPHQAMLYGATMVDDEMQHNANDNPPYGGFGGYQVLQVRGQKKYRTWLFTKARAAIPDWTGTTKGSSVSFATQPIRMRVMSPEFGPWYRVKEFANEADAKAYIETNLGVAKRYTVSVQAQGDGTVTPSGGTTVAEGGSVELTFSETPTALYINGVEKSSSVMDNKYAMTSISEDQKVAVIF